MGRAGVKTRQGLTEAKLRELQPGEQAYKVSDGATACTASSRPAAANRFAMTTDLMAEELLTQMQTQTQTQTQTLKTAPALVDLRVLDHLVVAGSDVCAFAERGLL